SAGSGASPAALLSLRQEDDLKTRAPVSRPHRSSVGWAANPRRARGRRSRPAPRTRGRAHAPPWSHERVGPNSDRAVEYGQMDRNPARGRRRRLKADKPAPVWLDSAEHIAALLDAAGELDREARADRQVPRRAILATLTLAGLRIGELVDLRWRDVDLAAG